KGSCLLYPRKRTCAVQEAMSALGQKRTYAPAQKGSLFDHLVSSREQGRGHREPKRPCGLEVDDQLEFCRLNDRKVGGLFTFKNPTNIGAPLTVHRCKIRPVAH